MISISTFAAVLWGLLIGAIGYFIGNFLLKKDTGNWKENFRELEKEHKSLQKAEKKALKDMGKFKGQAENLRTKFEESKELSETKIETLKTSKSQLTTQLEALKTTNTKLESSQKVLASDMDRLQQKFSKLQTKYQTDLEDLKEFKADKDKFNRYLKDYKAKLKVSEEQLARTSALTKKQAAELKDANEFVSTMRGLKARNKQLQSDLTYWEKKHYDTHHELTSLKATQEGMVQKYGQLESKMNAVNLTNQNMILKVQEFKTRFVNVNNEYHALLNKN